MGISYIYIYNYIYLYKSYIYMYLYNQSFYHSLSMSILLADCCTWLSASPCLRSLTSKSARWPLKRQTLMVNDMAGHFPVTSHPRGNGTFEPSDREHNCFLGCRKQVGSMIHGFDAMGFFLKWQKNMFQFFDGPKNSTPTIFSEFCQVKR